MDNQHRKISGYRELSQLEIDLMNDIKAKGLELGVLIERVKFHLRDQLTSSLDDPQGKLDFDRIVAAEPEKWAEMARANFQLGIMELVRAVAQPSDGL